MPWRPAAYPMVDESQATGLVADVYRDILGRLPMVPSLFKSLAVCPPYLAMAWQQASPVLGTEAVDRVSDTLITQVADVVPPHPDESVRATLGRFVDPLVRMLVVTVGLRLALEGALPGDPAAPWAPSSPDPLDPDLQVPSTESLDPAAVGRVRRDLGSPIVNSIWRAAADEGHLEAAWQHLGEHVRSTALAEAANGLQDAAGTRARGLDWNPVASPEALDAAGVTDAAPGVRSVLDAYELTLPRVLALVASNS